MYQNEIYIALHNKLQGIMQCFDQGNYIGVSYL